MKTHDEKIRKITVNLPDGDLAFATKHSGKGITETLREALKRYNHHLACQELLKLRGKVDFGMTWQELKELRD